MTIFRNGQPIELTEQEICDIYIAVQKRNYTDGVIQKLAEDYDIDLNIVEIDVESIAVDVMWEIAENDTIWDCEQEAYRRVIEKYLEERGN